MLINEGVGDTAVTDASLLGLATSERCTALNVSVAKTGVASLQCTMAGNPAVETETITLSRADTGTWTCETSALDKYAPTGCTGKTDK
ncbi:pilin [Marinobacterium weihaiense]|uniref:pilin n=1 Tax=Marinobacterium weihaiense TaxID=2851016 RepID=UPI0038991C1B